MPPLWSRFPYKDTSSSFIEITATAPELVYRASQGRGQWGEIQSWGRTLETEQKGRGSFVLEHCSSSKGPELSLWVQGTLQGQVALTNICGCGIRASWAQSIRRISAMTKASFMTILKRCRMTSWVRFQVKSQRQMQSVVASVKLWKLPSLWSENHSAPLVDISVLFLEHNCLTCKFGHYS